MYQWQLIGRLRLWQSVFQSYGAEVQATLSVLDLDPISKTEAYIFFMEDPTYKEMFFSCPNHERKCVLLTLMSRPKN